MKKNVILILLITFSSLFFVSCGEEEAMEPQIVNSKVSVKIDGKLWESQEIKFVGNAFEAGDWENAGLLKVYLNDNAQQDDNIISFDYQGFSGGISAAWFVTPQESTDVSNDTAYYAFQGETIILKNDGKIIEGAFTFDGRSPEPGTNAVREVDPPVSASFTEGTFFLDLSEFE